MAEAGHYNLRSNRRQETRIPTQLQLVEDEDFITQSLGSGHPTAGQVSLFDSSIDTSESDLDLSDMLKHSGRDFQNYPPTVLASDPDARSGGIGQVPSSSGHKNANLSYNDINEKILHQLSTLGDRLTKIEKRESSIGKKTKDRSKVKSSKKSLTILLLGAHLCILIMVWFPPVVNLLLVLQVQHFHCQMF